MTPRKLLVPRMNKETLTFFPGFRHFYYEGKEELGYTPDGFTFWCGNNYKGPIEGRVTHAVIETDISGTINPGLNLGVDQIILNIILHKEEDREIHPLMTLIEFATDSIGIKKLYDHSPTQGSCL